MKFYCWVRYPWCLTVIKLWEAVKDDDILFYDTMSKTKYKKTVLKK